MKLFDVNKLTPGFYRVWWNSDDGGGFSLAAIGVTVYGGRWIAPLNWVKPTDDQSQWEKVERVDRLSLSKE